MADRMTAQSALKAFVALVLALCAAGFVALWVSLASGSTPRDRIRRALDSLPVFHEDRGAPGKSAQYDAIADSLARHSRDPRVIAFVISWTIAESGLSMRIMSGRCKPLECDRGLARGPAQEHRNGRAQEEWDRLHGLENIDFQIASAVRRARGMLGMCKTAEGALRAMTGRGCSARLPGVEKRVETFNRVLGRL